MQVVRPPGPAYLLCRAMFLRSSAPAEGRCVPCDWEDPAFSFVQRSRVGPWRTVDSRSSVNRTDAYIVTCCASLCLDPHSVMPVLLTPFCIRRIHHTGIRRRSFPYSRRRRGAGEPQPCPRLGRRDRMPTGRRRGRAAAREPRLRAAEGTERRRAQRRRLLARFRRGNGVGRPDGRRYLGRRQAGVGRRTAGTAAQAKL